MKLLQSYLYSRLLRIHPTLHLWKHSSNNIITNSLVQSKYRLFLCKGKSTLANHQTTAAQDQTKHERDIKLHTDGLIKTIIKSGRELFRNLRDDFHANWGFNSILIVLMFSYIGVFIGRLKLEYEKAKREEKRMDEQVKLEYEKAKRGEKRMDEQVKLEYEKAKRREQQIYLDHEYKLLQLRVRPNFDPQQIEQIKSNDQSSLSK